jgi:RNA polymerase sigma factor (sigma-70 family)
MARGSLYDLVGHVRRLLGGREACALSDGQLLERFINLRDEAAFEQLMQRHGPMVLGVCRRILAGEHDVADAFQATFLVLLRRAGAIRHSRALGSWLYRVAFSAAVKARASATRQEALKKHMGSVLQTVPPPSDVGPELRAVLDEELQKLPNKYRSPLVLCYLEGRSNEQAAQELGWSKGTVSGRLARAREVLRGRLTRRGLALPSTFLAAELAQEAVPAPLQAALAETARLFVARQEDAIAAVVVALTEGVLQSMFWTKLKLAAAVVLAACVIGGSTGVFVYAAWNAPASQESERPASAIAANQQRPAPASTQPVEAPKGVAADPKPPVKELPPLGSAVVLPTNRDAQQRLSAAQDYVAEQEWAKCVRELQRLLNQPEDAFVQVTRENPDSKPILLWTTTWAEANRMIGAFPADGRQVYEDYYGREAQDLLDKAKQNDLAILADMARRFRHTKAGAEARKRLDELHKKQGQVAPASPPKVDLKALDPTWRVTTLAAATQAKDHQKTDPQRIAQLIKDLESNEFAARQRAADDLVRLGLAAEPALKKAMEGAPPLELYNRMKAILAQLPVEKGTQEIQELVEAGTRQVEQRNQPLLPAFMPIGVGDRLFFRTYDGVYAGRPREIPKRLQNKELIYDWYSFTGGGIVTLASNPNQKGIIDAWRKQYLQAGANTVFENSVTGTLSSDGSCVYLIDDLSIPPPPQFVMQLRMGWGGQPNFGALQQQVTQRNTLRAISVAYGSLRWELGGDRDPHDTRDSFFLGPPLALAGKLYVLNEKDGSLRLICLQPKDGNDKNPVPEIAWVQTIGLVKDKIAFDFPRRLQAISPVQGEGVLVCPTNAGAVFGVDLLTHQLLWASPYREPEVLPAKPAKLPGFQANIGPERGGWKVAPPVIHDGRVVFTAPDAGSVHCVRLQDGMALWRSSKGADELYFAGIQAGKVLLVGKNSCRALNLEDGKTAWQLEDTGLPSGRGVASGNLYYLPLKAGAESKEPEVCVIDVASGKIQERIRGKGEAPGNLLIVDGTVISQTASSVATYFR